jgi:hypothetical protein
MAALVEFARSKTAYFVKRKTMLAKLAEIAGAMKIPPKMAAIPLESFHPHWTASAPPTATPAPASAETIEYVVETGREYRVAIMSHEAETMRAQVKASI